MTTNQGSCLCESIKFELKEEPNRFFFCHCTRCRKVSGSVHASNLFYQDSSFKWLSGKDKVKTYAFADSHFKNSFCTDCGSRVPTVMENQKIMIPAGCLDTDVHIEPTAHIFCDSRANWEESIGTSKKFNEMPT